MRRVAPALFALLLLTAAMGGPFSGLAAAQTETPVEVGEECDTLDSLLYDAFSIGNIITDGDNPCSAEYQSKQVQDEYQERINETTLQVTYQRMVDRQKNIDDYHTTQRNYLQDTRTVAMAKGEEAAVTAIENAYERPEVKNRSADAVRDYYSLKQYNVLKKWNAEVEKLKTIKNISDNQGVAFNEVVTIKHTFHNTNGGSGTYNGSIIGFGATSITLNNGSSVQVQTITFNTSANGYSEGYIDPVNPHAVREDGSQYDHQMEFNELVINSISTDTVSKSTTMDQWPETFNSMADQSNQIADNSRAYAGSVYNATVEGNASAAEYLSPLSIAQERSLNYSDAGHYSYAIATLGSVGLSTPDLNSTGMMTVSYNGSSYEGFIASSEGPPNGWVSGETYNTANLNGSQLLVTRESGMMEMSGSFTVDEITDPEGNQVNSTNTRQVEYAGINNSQYLDLQQQIRELDAQTRAREPVIIEGGGGDGDGSDGFGLGGVNQMLLVAIAGGAAVLLLSRQ